LGSIWVGWSGLRPYLFDLQVEVKWLEMGFAAPAAGLLHRGGGLYGPGLGFDGLSWDWFALTGAPRACGARSDLTEAGVTAAAFG
jgi:hypothetical protein